MVPRNPKYKAKEGEENVENEEYKEEIKAEIRNVKLEFALILSGDSLISVF